MAKRVKMIAPFEALRGNVSGRQDLVYGSKEQKAWYSGQDKPYADNYNPRFVVGVRKATNRAYFQVKQKFAAINTAASRLNQAVLTGAKLMYDAYILEGYDLQALDVLNAYFLDQKSKGFEGTMYKCISPIFRQLLKSKRGSLVISAPAASGTVTATIYNPWRDGSHADMISQEMLVKFWTILNTTGITFEVIGAGTGIANDGNQFDDIIASKYNVLGLSTQDVGGEVYVKLGSDFLVDVDGEYTVGAVEPTENATYSLTDVQPS